MSIWNKVLLGMIIVIALAFFYMAARTLRTHQSWRELARSQKQRLDELQKENQELLRGSEDGTKPGVEQLQMALDGLVIDRNRGRVWYGCQPQQPNAQTGQVRVVAEQPDPHGIAVKSLLYVFEQTETDQGVGNDGHYLGQFEVEAVNAKQVVLKPARTMTPLELQRLVKSKGPWAMYEVMPVDAHDIFAGLSDEDKKKILPQESLDSYLKDGQPATWEQIEKWGVTGTLVDESGKALVQEKTAEKSAEAKGTFVRRLRDYQSLFQWYDLERTRLFDLLKSGEQDRNYMQAAAADAKQSVKFREGEIAALKADLSKQQAEQTAVLNYYHALTQKIADLKAAVLQLVRDNQALASEIAKIQLNASRRIDERLRTMAQTRQTGQ